MVYLMLYFLSFNLCVCWTLLWIVWFIYIHLLYTNWREFRADPDVSTWLGVKSKRDIATHYDLMVIHRETVYMLVVLLPFEYIWFLECFNVWSLALWTCVSKKSVEKHTADIYKHRFLLRIITWKSQRQRCCVSHRGFGKNGLNWFWPFTYSS